MPSPSRYKTILADVAKQLGCEPGDEQAKHVAFLRMVRDNMTTAAIRGERVNVADARELDAALKQYLPERKQPDTINVRFVQTLVTRCGHCGKLGRVSNVPSGDPRETVVTPAEAEAVLAAADSAAPAAPAPAPAAPAEPAKPVDSAPVIGYRGVSASAFHDQVLAGGSIAPLKKRQASYGPRKVVSPLSDDPTPQAARRPNAPAGLSAFDDPNPTRKDPR